MTADQTTQSAALAVLAELTAFVAEAQARRTRLITLRTMLERSRDNLTVSQMQEVGRHLRLADTGIAACSRTIQLCGAAFYATGVCETDWQRTMKHEETHP